MAFLITLFYKQNSPTKNKNQYETQMVFKIFLFFSTLNKLNCKISVFLCDFLSHSNKKIIKFTRNYLNS